MTRLEDVLRQRGDRYGEFADNAHIAQELKAVLERGENYHKLDDTQTEGLSMICTKISRIITGDPDYDDNWKDIAGFAELVYKHCVKKAEDQPKPLGTVGLYDE